LQIKEAEEEEEEEEEDEWEWELSDPRDGKKQLICGQQPAAAAAAKGGGGSVLGLHESKQDHASDKGRVRGCADARVEAPLPLFWL